MRKAATQPATRPFHETIVDAIHDAEITDAVVDLLAFLIKETTIPAGHDEIIAVWNEQTQGIIGKNDDPDVTTSLLGQKRAAEEKAKHVMTRGDVVELRTEARQLALFLQNLGFGQTITLCGELREQLELVHRLTSRALGK